MSVTIRMYPQAEPNVQAELAKRLKMAKPHLGSIGIHEEEGSQPKRDYYGEQGVELLAEAMVLHEYGAQGLPERSFLRSFFDQRKSFLMEGMTAAMRAELAGDASAVSRWIEEVAGIWKAWIQHGPFAALSPITVRKKEAAGLPVPSQPLIATSQFIEAWRAKMDGKFVTGYDS